MGEINIIKIKYFSQKNYIMHEIDIHVTYHFARMTLLISINL